MPDNPEEDPEYERIEGEMMDGPVSLNEILIMNVGEFAALVEADGFAVVFVKDGRIQQYIQAARDSDTEPDLMKLRVALAEAFDVPPEEFL